MLPYKHVFISQLLQMMFVSTFLNIWKLSEHKQYMISLVNQKGVGKQRAQKFYSNNRKVHIAIDLLICNCYLHPSSSWVGDWMLVRWINLICHCRCWQTLAFTLYGLFTCWESLPPWCSCLFGYSAMVIRWSMMAIL